MDTTEARSVPPPTDKSGGDWHYVINTYFSSGSKNEQQTGPQSYDNLLDYEVFESQYLRDATVITDPRFGLQCSLAYAFIEGCRIMNEIKQWLTTSDQRSAAEINLKQQTLSDAQRCLKRVTYDIRTVWEKRTGLAIWGSHCQGLTGTIRRFEPTQFQELLRAWMDTRKMWIISSPDGVVWLDKWMKSLKNIYMIEDDVVQYSETWSKIHDCGDETYSHEVVSAWQRQVNIFRFKHRKTSTLPESIQGMKARLVRYKNQIINEADINGWNQINDYFDTKLARYSNATYQLIHLELCVRLEQHPWQMPFSDLDIVALDDLTTRTRDSLEITGMYEGELSGPVLFWLDHFKAILPYDRICVGFAWNMIRFTSLQQADSFLILNLYPRTRVVGPLSSPISSIAQASTRTFLQNLRTFYKARKEAFKRHKKRLLQNQTVNILNALHTAKGNKTEYILYPSNIGSTATNIVDAEAAYISGTASDSLRQSYNAIDEGLVSNGAFATAADAKRKRFITRMARLCIGGADILGIKATVKSAEANDISNGCQPGTTQERIYALKYQRKEWADVCTEQTGEMQWYDFPIPQQVQTSGDEFGKISMSEIASIPSRGGCKIYSSARNSSGQTQGATRGRSHYSRSLPKRRNTLHGHETAKENIAKKCRSRSQGSPGSFRVTFHLQEGIIMHIGERIDSNRRPQSTLLNPTLMETPPEYTRSLHCGGSSNGRTNKYLEAIPAEGIIPNIKYHTAKQQVTRQNMVQPAVQLENESIAQPRQVYTFEGFREHKAESSGTVENYTPPKNRIQQCLSVIRPVVKATFGDVDAKATLFSNSHFKKPDKPITANYEGGETPEQKNFNNIKISNGTPNGRTYKANDAPKESITLITDAGPRKVITG